MSDYGWTQERVDQLKKWWNEGVSAKDIATRLKCGMSRNAVIGKIHRLRERGVDLRTVKQQPAVRASGIKRNRVSSPGRLVTPKPAPAPLPAPPMPASASARMLTLDELQGRQCRFVCGESRRGEALFCGLSTPAPESWCAHHAAVVFTQAAPRRRARQMADTYTLRWAKRLAGVSA